VRVIRALIGVIFLVVVVALVVGAKLHLDFLRFRETPYGTETEKIVVIPPGTSAREVVRLLARGGALSDEKMAWRYVRWLKRDPRPFKSGEFDFSGPLRPDDVLERVYKGDVKTYHFTVPEGVRMDEIARIVEEAGLGDADALLALMRDPAYARELGVPFPTLEGYLFPDTYSFGRDPRPRQVISAMVGRFREAWKQAEAQREPDVSLDERQAVTLASIVEKETGAAEERARISCVFHNRLRKKMKLQTDPTVLYAKWLRTGEWSKNIGKADLERPHPYNTYAVPGLPPGPIASPGAAALLAALHPAACGDLYFVSRNDGTHVFCPDLRCHAAAVQKWQVEYFRKKRRAARQRG